MGCWGPGSGLGVSSRVPIRHWKTAPGLEIPSLSLLALGLRKSETSCGLHVRGMGTIIAFPRVDARRHVRAVPVHSAAPAVPCPHLVQHRRVQLLLLNTQVADPGQEFPGLDEEAGAQQEGEDVGFLGDTGERRHVLTRTWRGHTSPYPRPKTSPSPVVSPMPGGGEPTHSAASRPTWAATHLGIVVGCGHQVLDQGVQGG